MTRTSDRICFVVRSYVGCSLDAGTDALGQLVARNVDDPAVVVAYRSNCATTALGFLWLLGVDHPVLRRPYQIGMAVAWLFELGRDLGIIHAYHGDVTELRPGMLLHYVHTGRTDDHVEWLLSDVDERGEADHAGGGRDRNAIAEGHGSILFSSGRPLAHYFDVPGLLEPKPEAA